MPAFSNPATSRSRVDLPHPDGPTSATSSPAETVTETSSKAWVPSGKVSETLSTRICGRAVVVMSLPQFGGTGRTSDHPAALDHVAAIRPVEKDIADLVCAQYYEVGHRARPQAVAVSDADHPGGLAC